MKDNEVSFLSLPSGGNSMRYKLIILIICSVVFFPACNQGKKRPNINGREVDLKIHRFEDAFFTMDTTILPDESLRLQRQFPKFFDLYTQGILRAGKIEEAIYSNSILIFLSDPVQQHAYKEVKGRYDDFSDYEKSFKDAFSIYAYYFPTAQIPDLYTFVGYFNQSVVLDEGLVAVALEKYLSPDYPKYLELGIPSFIRSKMDSRFLVTDVMQAIAQVEFPFNDSLDNLVSNLIWEGRNIYFASCMVPEAEDADLLRFQGKEYEYCKTYEREMWRYLVDNKYLFSQDDKVIRRYLSDGPFTPGFDNSPSRVGVFIGYQIVKSFMKRNAAVNLSELMQMDDYLYLLNASGYQP